VSSIKKDVLLIWCGVIYLLITTTRILSFWKIVDLDSTRSDSINPIITIIGNLLALYFLIYMFRFKSKILNVIKQQWPIILLLLFTLLSCFWSDFPYISLRRWFKMSFFYTFILALQLSGSFYENTKSVIFIYGKIAIIISFILIILFPSYGWMIYEDKLLPMGIFEHKGLLGQFSSLMLLLFMFFSDLKKISKDTLFTFLLFILLLMTETKGALICLMISIFTFIYVKIDPGFKQNKITFFLSLIFLMITIYISFFTILQQEPFTILIEQVFVLIGKNSSLTGRVPLWSILFEYGMNNPILGVGYRVFFIGFNATWFLKIFEWDCTNAHNGFLQAFLEVGIIGTVIFIFCLVWLLIKAIKNMQITKFKTNSIILFAMLIEYILLNFSSDCFLSERFCVFVFLLIPNLFEKEKSFEK